MLAWIFKLKNDLAFTYIGKTFGGGFLSRLNDDLKAFKSHLVTETSIRAYSANLKTFFNTIRQLHGTVTSGTSITSDLVNLELF